MDQNTFDVYNALAENNLQSFFVAFNQTLNISQKRDFVLICRSDLHCIGLTSRSSINNFEELLKSVKNLEENKRCNFDYTQFYIDTILPNQEPVIIGTNDVNQETILGSGHFGKVYKGTWQRKTQEGKAVKVPVAVKTLSDGTEMSWKKEVSIFTALNQNHSSIIKFCGLLIGEEDKIQMVTEFAALGSLLDRLKAKDITSIATLSQFSVQISSGMVFLHSKNLVHRDLSARNILVTAKNQVKISDFGLSKVVDEKKKEWVMEGSESLPMRWLAPESISNGIFTASSDVWSFAVVLWEMFTFGDIPWGGQSNEQVKSKIQNGECLGEPKLCPCDIYEVMTMCFTYDPQIRPTFIKIQEELFKRQPMTYEATSPSTERYDLNFNIGDFITSIKPISATGSNFWLGQHEDSLLFGRFEINNTKPISYSIPYSLGDRSTEEFKEIDTEDDMLMHNILRQVKPYKEKESNFCESFSQPTNDDDTCYVNMSPPSRPIPPKAETKPIEPSEPEYQVPKLVVKKSPIENLKMEESEEKSKRRHSEVLSSREGFFDLSPPSSSTDSGQLKSDSDSQILFKDTKPDVQIKVMDGIAKNWTAFLSLTDKKEATESPADDSRYLNPIDISSVKLKVNLNSVIMDVDPYAKSESASCENIYSEIGNRNFSANNQFLRPRPKGTIQKQHHLQRDTETLSAYRKSSLGAYASNVKKDFELLAERIGTKSEAVSNDNLLSVSDSSKVSVEELQNYPSFGNKQYLSKFDSIIPITSTTNVTVPQQQNQVVSPSDILGSTNTGTYPFSQSNSCPNNKILHVSASQFQASPDYNNFVSDQKQLNQFTYGPKSVSNLKSSPVMSKGESRQALSNYTSNNWDLFDDYVQDSKKFDIIQAKNTSAKDISWQKGQTSFTNKENESLNNKEFSAKFQKIRSILPDISVSECLEGLRYSHNNVENAIKFIQVQKLTRCDYGFSFGECEKIFNECKGDFLCTENLLKTKYLKEKFSYLSESQIKETLQVYNWNINLASKTIFVQQCIEFGIPELKALYIYNECQENITKSMEKAKTIRVAEITNQPEHHCFKMLTHCKWNVERTVNHIFSKVTK